MDWLGCEIGTITLKFEFKSCDRCNSTKFQAVKITVLMAFGAKKS